MEKNKEKSSPAFLFILILLFAFSISVLKETENKQAKADIESSNSHKTINTINWEDSFKKTSETLMNESRSYLDTIQLGVEKETNEIFITVSLEDVPSDDELINYLERIIYHISRFTAKGTDLRPPSQNTLDYGGVFDYYNMVIGVSTKEKMDNPDDWLIHYKIPKGSHKKIKIRKNET